MTAAVHLDEVADRIRGVPQPPGKPLADDRNRRRSRSILSAELASREQGHPQRAKQSIADDLLDGRSLHLGRRSRCGAVAQRCPAANPRGERNTCHETYGTDRRERFERLDQRSLKGERRVRVRVRSRGDAQSRGDHAVGVESERHVLQAHQALRQQRRHYYQHRCQRRLRDDEAVAPRLARCSRSCS